VVKFLLWVQKFFRYGRRGGAGPPNVNLGPPNISETTTDRKLNLKIPLDMVQYPLWVQNFFPLRRLGGTGPPNANWGPRPGS